METRVNYLLVGIFVLLLGTGLLASILWFTLRPDVKIYDSYKVYMTDSVSGLNKEAPVKYNGVEVGRVARISLDQENPERVKLLLEIEHGTPIRQSTVATLESQGITGIAYVNLTSTSQRSPLMEPHNKEPYPEIRSGRSLLTRLDEGITRLISTLIETSDSMRSFISGTNKDAINRILMRLEQLLDSLTGQTDAMSKTLKYAAHTIEKSAQASDNLPDLINNLNHASSSLEQMANEISMQSKGIGSVTTKSVQSMGKFIEESSLHVGLLSADLQHLVQRLEKLIDSIEDNPDGLLFGRPQSPPGPGEQK